MICPSGHFVALARAGLALNDRRLSMDDTG
jgi:hypothetical protein